MNSNRETLISRVKKEIIGPGSDLFECSDKKNFSDEIIAEKPLTRYSSGILYPKQTTTDDFVDDDDQNEEIPDTEDLLNEGIVEEMLEKNETISHQELKEDDRESSNSTNTFFPSLYGISFSISKECKDLNIIVSFGNYRKANAKEVRLPFPEEIINVDTGNSLLDECGLSQYVEYDEKNKIIGLTKDLTKDRKKVCYDSLKVLGDTYGRDSLLYKTLYKLFYKDKYKRYDNKINTTISVDTINLSKGQHYKILLSAIEGVDSDKWWKGKSQKEDTEEKALKDHLWLHVKLYDKGDDYIVKVFIENDLFISRTRFSNAKESLNMVCLFQTEIKVETPFLQPFNKYEKDSFKSDEDRMLDFLYREKYSYGVGHNTACTWENCENDHVTPTWISTTFLPQYNVKSQSTDISSVGKKILEIKQLSVFCDDKGKIVPNLNSLADAYLTWINDEEKKAELQAFENIEKCKKIYERINKGIELLRNSANVFRAFQLANTAIYLQMFQTQWHFSKQKDGFEAFERTEIPQYSFQEYANKEFPDPKQKPCWRPFQLTFILQCIPSFIEDESKDRDLVDLLYFPTGGGKTEAYLALSAFLIFWRRLQYPDSYGGVNIIIRYTLRLLSAQQFERATKLILACEFIRKNQTDLGTERITIGFWVGGSTIPNKIKDKSTNCAQDKLDTTYKRLNNNQFVINPFQLSNCQWCNTKIIGRTIENNHPNIGHIISRNHLRSFCLNPQCEYSERNSELPIVLVDEDIYDNPPTMLFATVDKFAQLAWKGEATSLFNKNNYRKPELIIQDELHLLSGPLGSLVGLFENVILSLCTTETQRPKIIVSTATVKNVEKQVEGLYSRSVSIFPQNATNADDTFFSKSLSESKRRYVGILPTGKTQTMTNLRLNAALFFARLELWKDSLSKPNVDQYWTILSYFKSLKHIGRFSNKITAELQPEIKQLQVRYLMNVYPYFFNYNKLPYRYLELTSRIPNEKIKKNLDKLNITFDGNIEKYQAYDIVLASNMISVGLDVSRLNIMLMNGMPPNTAEYIQASSRVARKNEGVVFTLFDPNNTRDLSYFEDYIAFHKTFYKQVEPISVTPFAENALDKMLFTVIVSYFRHKLGFAGNKMPCALRDENNRERLKKEMKDLFNKHRFPDNEDKQLIESKIDHLIQEWKYKIESTTDDGLYYYGGRDETEKKKNLFKPIQEQSNTEDVLICMQSMRSVEPSANIKIKQY